KRGVVRPHEMPRVSENVEAKMKHVFAGYIPSDYPRVMIAGSFLLDTPLEEVPYYHLVARYPETIREEDQEDYLTGMYHINEWATNYAAMHYIEKVSSDRVTTPIRSAYAWYSDALVARANTPSTYKAMGEVKKTARTNGMNLGQA